MTNSYQQIIGDCIAWMQYHDGTAAKPAKPLKYSLRQMVHAGSYLRNLNVARAKRTPKGKQVTLFNVPSDSMLAALYLASRVSGNDPAEGKFSSITCANGNYVFIGTPKVSEDEQKAADTKQINLLNAIAEAEKNK